MTMFDAHREETNGARFGTTYKNRGQVVADFVAGHWKGGVVLAILAFATALWHPLALFLQQGRTSLWNEFAAAMVGFLFLRISVRTIWGHFSPGVVGAAMRVIGMPLDPDAETENPLQMAATYFFFGVYASLAMVTLWRLPTPQWREVNVSVVDLATLVLLTMAGAAFVRSGWVLFVLFTPFAGNRERRCPMNPDG